MQTFKDKVAEFVGKEIFLKDINGSSYGGILKEFGEDYCILAIAKRTLLYKLDQIVSVEPRMQSPTDTPVSEPLADS